jgi:3-oxoadipate CoA-transferase alpha subunit
MINKHCISADEAVQEISSGDTVMVSGFGDPGTPFQLLHALARRKVDGLTLIANNAGRAREGVAALLDARIIRKIVCCYPKRVGSFVFEKLYAAGEIEFELVPQGTLVERIRAGAAGLGGFYTPTTYGTNLGEGKEVREIDGKNYVFEKAIKADFALIKAHQSDRFGNLIYHKSARNFGPVMAGAATTTIAEVDQHHPHHPLEPETIVTPGIFIDKVISHATL